MELSENERALLLFWGSMLHRWQAADDQLDALIDAVLAEQVTDRPPLWFQEAYPDD